LELSCDGAITHWGTEILNDLLSKNKFSAMEELCSTLLKRLWGLLISPDAGPASAGDEEIKSM
jgi:hypothetical protein